MEAGGRLAQIVEDINIYIFSVIFVICYSGFC